MQQRIILWEDLVKMPRIFDIELHEDFDGEIQCLLENVDPIYWRAIVVGIANMQARLVESKHGWNDVFFDGVYGAVMEMEDVMERRLSRYRRSQRDKAFDPYEFDITAKSDKE